MDGALCKCSQVRIIFFAELFCTVTFAACWSKEQAAWGERATATKILILKGMGRQEALSLNR
jgi:hypothetical protein